MKLLRTVEKVIDLMGLRTHDCHPELPRDKMYRGLGVGGGAICVEEAMAMTGIIWAVKPDFLIELGTSNGGSSVVLAAALKDLGHGVLITVDKALSAPKRAKEISDALELPIRYVTDKLSLEFLSTFKPDPHLRYMVFSDTEIAVRPDEVAAVIATYPEDTVVMVHDTSPKHPSGPMNLPSKIQNKQIFELPTPRGLSILRT